MMLSHFSIQRRLQCWLLQQQLTAQWQNVLSIAVKKKLLKSLLYYLEVIIEVILQVVEIQSFVQIVLSSQVIAFCLQGVC